MEMNISSDSDDEDRDFMANLALEPNERDKMEKKKMKRQFLNNYVRDL